MLQGVTRVTERGYVLRAKRTDWIARCNSVKHVNADIIHFAKYNLGRVATQKKIKFYSRLARIQEEDPQLYSSISKAIGNDRQD